MMFSTHDDGNSSNEEYEQMENSPSAVTQIYYTENKNYSGHDGPLASSDHQTIKGGLDDVCGMPEIKETLKITFIYPSLFSSLFPKKIRWKKILLHGPSGTGKTMLGKATAAEMRATLHRISCADMLSYWRHNSEEQIRKLFQHVRSDSESTIVLFFDDLNELYRTRSPEENDYVKRIQTELRAQLEEFGSSPEDFHVYILAATTSPWKIDPALKNCFHKKIYVPLPERETRLEIIKNNFEGIELGLKKAEWNEVLERTEGYSGTDLENLVMNSCCERFLEMKNCEYWCQEGDFWYPSTSEYGDVTKLNFDEIPKNKIVFREIKFTDIIEALKKTPKTVNKDDLSKYLEIRNDVRKRSDQKIERSRR